MPMRRLCLTLLCGLTAIAVPAALAATRAANDGVLELRGVAGSVVMTGARGTLWGQLDKGRLIVTDPVAGDGEIYVTGADRIKPINDNVTYYYGSDIHFRVTSGRYRLSFKAAAGLDLTAVGVGTAVLIGDITSDKTGSYSLDGGKWTSVPYLQKTVQFGTVPAPAATP